MTYSRHIFVLLIIVISTLALHAQRENRYIRRGNNDFEDRNFPEAEKDYLRFLSKSEDPHKGLFNLGDVYYEQNNYQQAGILFDSVARLQIEEDVRSKAFYNLGNTLLSASLGNDTVAAEALPLSIESYKEALRINPLDSAAKYNLAYAQQMLNNQQQNQQDQQNQQNQQNQDQQDQNQDQNQDQQDQNQDQDQQDQNQDQQDQQDQNQDQQDQNQDQQDQQNNNQQQQQSSQQKPRQISKEDAERMLEAMKNDEKKTLEKVKLGKTKGRVVKSEKDW